VDDVAAPDDDMHEDEDALGDDPLLGEGSPVVDTLPVPHGDGDADVVPHSEGVAVDEPERDDDDETESVPEGLLVLDDDCDTETELERVAPDDCVALSDGVVEPESVDVVLRERVAVGETDRDRRGEEETDGDPDDEIVWVLVKLDEYVVLSVAETVLVGEFEYDSVVVPDKLAVADVVDDTDGDVLDV
jgi:hypothetical protein